MKKSQIKHLSSVAALSCACCGNNPPSCVHHIREGQGMAQRASDFLTIPLCPDCHQGPTGVHGDQSMMRIYKLTELQMLAKTIERLQDAS